MDRMRNLLKPSGSRSRLRDGVQAPEGTALPSPPLMQLPPSPPVAAPRDEDEELRLALALSAAEQARTAASGASHAAARPRAAPSERPLEPTDSDEAIARHLQEQLNLEAAAAGSRRAAPGYLPPPDMPLAPPQSPAGPVPMPSAPHWRQPAPSAPRPAHASAGPWSDMRPMAVLPANPNVCGGCGKPVGMWPAFATALGRRWHPSCLRCAHCQAPIQVRTFPAPRCVGCHVFVGALARMAAHWRADSSTACHVR